MGSHIDTRSKKNKPVMERDELARRSRATFKQYLRHIEEDLLEEEELEDKLEDDLNAPEQDE